MNTIKAYENRQLKDFKIIDREKYIKCIESGNAFTSNAIALYPCDEHDYLFFTMVDKNGRTYRRYAYKKRLFVFYFANNQGRLSYYENEEIALNVGGYYIYVQATEITKNSIVKIDGDSLVVENIEII